MFCTTTKRRREIDSELNLMSMMLLIRLEHIDRRKARGIDKVLGENTRSFIINK